MVAIAGTPNLIPHYFGISVIVESCTVVAVSGEYEAVSDAQKRRRCRPPRDFIASTCQGLSNRRTKPVRHLRCRSIRRDSPSITVSGTPLEANTSRCSGVAHISGTFRTAASKYSPGNNLIANAPRESALDMAIRLGAGRGSKPKRRRPAARGTAMTTAGGSAGPRSDNTVPATEGRRRTTYIFTSESPRPPISIGWPVMSLPAASIALIDHSGGSLLCSSPST